MNKEEISILRYYAFGNKIRKDDLRLLERAASTGIICFGTEHIDNALVSAARLTKRGLWYTEIPLWKCAIDAFKRKLKHKKTKKLLKKIA